MTIKDFKDTIINIKNVTLALAGKLLSDFIFIAILEVAKEQLSGPDKKTFIMKEVGDLFDFLAPKIPVPIFIYPIQSITRPIFKKIVLKIADGIIESVYIFLKVSNNI